jgi:hexosaminidase
MNRCISLLLCVAILCGFTPKNDKEDLILVKEIKMGAMQGDHDKSEFSILVDFVAQKETNIPMWEFGFYLLGAPLVTFISENQKVNPRLVMEICDEANYCTGLKYQKSTKITDIDLSQGYTTILSPLTSFPIKKGINYTIKILHINQWGGNNISYFPQSFFFIQYDNNNNYQKKLHYIKTDFKSYKIVNYQQEKVNNFIKKDKENKWKSSIQDNKNEKSLSLVPSPAYIKLEQEYKYKIKKNILINNEFSECSDVSALFIKNLRNDLKANIINVPSKDNLYTQILIKKLNDPTLISNNPEGYVLSINHKGVEIEALNAAGVYYAFQTLRQIYFDVEKKDAEEISIPQLTIIDYPRFKYRGIMLDVARHFFTVSEVKSFINLMGVHKLNTLHLHLSDDEAFRIKIPPYPLKYAYTRGLGLPIGPTMLSQINLYNTNAKTDNSIRAGNVYSGSYSYKDIREIIKYANLNQITVIPELDFPAHSRALIKALPSILIDPDDKSNYISAQGYTDNVLPVCTYDSNTSIGKKFTKTVNNIINNVANIFSGQKTIYAIDKEISIGGDEVSPDSWTKTKSCQGEWDNLDSNAKSHKFFSKLSKNHTSIIFSGWQQFIQNNGVELGKDIVDYSRVGHVWIWNKSNETGIDQAINLANNNFPIVLTFADKMYFDIVYTPDISEPGLAWSAPNNDTYSVLSSAQISNEVQKRTQLLAHNNILGLEGALWSENLLNYDQLVYMAVPKMAGLSEASWSPSTITIQNNKINWQNLSKRLGCGQRGFLYYLNTIHDVKYRGYPRGISLEIPELECYKF